MATGTYAYPGNANTFVKNHEATNRLTIAFSRNPKEFPLPKYCQYREVKKTAGLYLRIKAEECARIVYAGLEDYVWPDGADAPKRTELEAFRYEDYRTTRYAFPMQIGAKAMDEADWDVMGINQAFNLQKAMTARTVRAIAALTNTSNWDTSHYEYVDNITGVTGDWENSTSALQNIKKSIQYAVEQIHLDTLGVVKKEDLILLMSPTTARKVGTSQEIIDFVKQQPSAPAIISGKDSWLLEEYGLPARLYGLPIEIEDCVRVATQRGATTQTKAFALAEGNAFVLARPGSIESVAGTGPSFSTLTAFLKEEMTVESKRDPDQRREETRVVDDFDIVMTAPVSGFWFRGVTDSTTSSSGA